MAGVGTMRALSMRRRYERTLPVLLAIVVASAVTVGVALLVLPGGDGDGDGGALDAAVPAATVVDTTPSPADQGGQVAEAPSATNVAGLSAESTVPNPTPTARGIRRPSATPSPTATRGPELSENLVVNGGFSDALDHWYVENDTGVADGVGRRGGPAVRIGSGGGYADQQLPVAPGRTYRLQAWGRVSIDGGSGVVGIIYHDAAGNRLEGEEPSPLVMNETTLTRQSLTFTPPADAATVRVYFWKPSSPAELIVDDVSVREYLSDANSTATP
jgi:hypothetical protein